jgi:2-C-methyl-D-erythritol 2,4-cyclodiphosphate synthase
MRIGQGYDVHPFGPGRTLVLGGVAFDGETGLTGHTDGDALCHAVIDALLGAAALGDVGMHFPSGDPRLRDADSIELLKQVTKLVSAAGCAIVNIDTTIIAERPQMAPHVPEMRRRLAIALGVDLGQVSVKATTSDGLGFVGRGEGIAVQATALLDQVAK